MKSNLGYFISEFKQNYMQFMTPYSPQASGLIRVFSEATISSSLLQPSKALALISIRPGLQTSLFRILPSLNV